MSHTGMRAADKNGIPANLRVPEDDVYDATESESQYRPLATKAHPEVPYFNAARLNKTIEYMKDRCEYPVLCKIPMEGMEGVWNNFPTCLRICATIYSALEGYSRSGPEAAKVESFMFHNHYQWKTKRKMKDQPKKKEVVIKKKPFVFFLHKKMVSGRARFVNQTETCFANFIKLFRENEDAWRPFLMDQGNN